ncbi:MAG: glycosyltransferase [Acidimicrobiales bacterium]
MPARPLVGSAQMGPGNGSQEPMKALLTVVICTNRPAKYLQGTLEALHRQTARGQLEIVVVDDGAPEPLRPLCDNYGANLLRHEHNRGLAAARNTGWRAATAPIVAFTDDDCRPQRGWAAALLGAYEDERVEAVGGSVVPTGRQSLLGRYYVYNNPIAPLEAEIAQSSSIAYRAKLYLRANLTIGTRTAKREVASLPGASMSVRRVTLERLGGFDEQIRFGGEDEDLFFRLRSALPDAKVIFDPSAVTEHDFDAGLGDALRRARSYGRGCARNFLRHDDWGPTVFPLPLLVLALVAAGLRCPRLLLAALALPPLAFLRWSRLAARLGRPDAVVFAYVQLLQEGAADLGFAQGYLRFRKDFHRERLAKERAESASL